MGVGGTAPCASASTSGGADITTVSLSNLSNAVPTNGSCPGYVDFTALTPANLPVGQTIPISISTASCNATNNDRIGAVYIDYNDDGTFEPNELAYTSAATLAGTVNGSFTVPTTAVVGSFARMRVIAQETSSPGAISPCGTYTNGQTQDYLVAFTNPATDVGIIDLESPTQTTCSSDSTLVAVRIHNYGITAQTGGVPVSTVVSQGGTVAAADSIPAGSDVVYTYSGVSLPTIAGDNYTFVSNTALSTDVNTSNDSNTTTVTVNPGAAAISGSATVCGSNATSVQLKANATGDDVPLWYNSQTATIPIAAGNNTTSTDVTGTYYVALNDLNTKGGSPNALAYAPTSASPGFYYPLDGQFMSISTSVPLTLQSARLYVGHSGQITFTLGTLVSIDPVNGYYYFPLTSTTVDVYATKQVPQSGRINVGAGQMTDTGGVFDLNIPIPTPGDYILIAQCSDSTNLFLNSGITADHYPVSIPGVFAVTGNSNKYDPNNPADSVTYFQQYYFPIYDIGVTLDACPGPRTAVTPTTEPAPSITLAGNIFTSSADSGNQWYLNDSLLTGKTAMTDTALFSGVYYTAVTDPNTGCVLNSNKLTYAAGAGIGLKVGNNPATTALPFFNVIFQTTTASNASIELYDVLGQRVYEAQYPNFVGIFNQPIYVNNLAAGMNVMKLIVGGTAYHEKLIVTKK